MSAEPTTNTGPTSAEPTNAEPASAGPGAEPTRPMPSPGVASAESAVAGATPGASTKEVPTSAADEPGTTHSLAALQELIHTKYDLAVDTIDPDKPMLELGLDSLAVAEFLFEVEDHFAIRLADDDPSIDTLRKLSVLVDRTIAAKEAAPT